MYGYKLGVSPFFKPLFLKSLSLTGLTPNLYILLVTLTKRATLFYYTGGVMKSETIKSDTVGIRLPLEDIELLDEIAADHLHTRSRVCAIMVKAGLNDYREIKKGSQAGLNVLRILGSKQASTDSSRNG